MHRARTIDAPSQGGHRAATTRTSVIAAGMLAALLPAGQARATPPTEVTMTITLGPRTVTDRRVADDNLFLAQTTASTLSGDVDGSLIYDMRLVLHLATGKGNYTLVGTFEGTVTGNGGAAVLEAEGTIDGGTQHARWRMKHGTDGLAGVHAEGECAGPLGGPISCWGTVHFDP